MILRTVSHPERIVPDETEPGIVALHLKRYAFARPLCEGRDVLDAACGTGYGSAFLAEAAAHVVGVDASEGALAYARGRYGRDNIEFAMMDVQRLELPDASFDTACSFETIEHVADPERAIAELVRVLRPRGVLVVSTPHAPVTTHAPANPFHTVELSRADFEALLRRHFSDVVVYGQRRLQSRAHLVAQRLDVLGLRRRFRLLRRASRLLGTPAVEEAGLADIVISAERIEDATELVAVCRRP